MRSTEILSRLFGIPGENDFCVYEPKNSPLRARAPKHDTEKTKKTTSDPPPVPQNNASVYLLEAVKRTLRRGQWEVPHGAARRGVARRGRSRRGAVGRARAWGGDARTSRALMKRARVMCLWHAHASYAA